MSDITQLESAASLFQMRAEQVDARLLAAKSGVTAPQNPAVNAENAELENASQQFEALLLNQMLREMRNTVPESGLFEKSMAEEIFTSMLDEQYADAMARSGGIGLARMIVDQLQNDPRVTGGKLK